MQHQVILKNGDVLPAIGQGTWYLGEHPDRLEQETEGIRAGRCRSTYSKKGGCDGLQEI